MSLVANVISAINLALFLWGRTLWRTHLKRHILIMLGVYISDVTLVLSLVFYRQALDRVHVQMPLILMIHIPIAILTLLLYTIAIWTGSQLWRKPTEHVRVRLRLLDRSLIIFRTLTLVTSLMVSFLK